MLTVSSAASVPAGWASMAAMPWAMTARSSSGSTPARSAMGTKVSGWTFSPAVVPAGQRLVPVDRPVGVEDRLQGGSDPTGRHVGGERQLHVEVVRVTHAQGRGVLHDGELARALGCVHREVCPLEQLGAVDQAVAVCHDRYADARVHPQRTVDQHDRGGERGEDAFGQRQGVAVVLDQHAELVAAEAGHAVSGTDRGGQPGGDGDQQRVAGVVAKGVVDRLEVVEVAEQNGQRPEACGGAARSHARPGRRTAPGWPGRSAGRGTRGAAARSAAPGCGWRAGGCRAPGGTGGSAGPQPRRHRQ